MALALVAAPAQAEIIDSSAGGFASSNRAVVAASVDETWAMLLQPELWWSHTWSDDSANLSLDARAGGCFCESVPMPAGGEPGSVEHMRVVMVLPRSTLRMAGALGPLQAEGVSGTLTVTLNEAGEGTLIAWDYVIGGQWRMPPEMLAGVVDGVQQEFLGGLVAALGGPVEAQPDSGVSTAE